MHKEPEPSTLAAALSTFPFQYRDEGVVQSANTGRHPDDVARSPSLHETAHRGSIPTGISGWGVSEEELPQVCVRPRDAASDEDLKVAEGTKPLPKSQEDGPILSLQATAYDWEGPWQ